MDAAGVLPCFAGVAVRDAWAPYDTYSRITHALCNAHVLREPQAVTDTTPQGPWCWAQQAADALREMNQLVKDAPAASGNLDGGDLDDIDAVALAAAIHRYRSAVLLGMEATRTRDSKLMVAPGPPSPAEAFWWTRPLWRRSASLSQVVLPDRAWLVARWMVRWRLVAGRFDWEGEKGRTLPRRCDAIS